MRRLPAYLYVADLVTGKRVLEVQCGDGAGAAFLAGCGAARVLGVDGSPDQIARARRHHRLANLELRCQQVTRLELEDGSIDLVCVPDARGLIRNREALDELRRVLAPGGWLIACAASAGQPGAEGGLSYHELGECLQPLFAPVRMAAQAPFVGVALCEYAGGDAAAPAVALDRSLAGADRDDDVTGYLAICGGRPGPARGFTVVELPQADSPRALEEKLRREQARRAELEHALEEAEHARAGLELRVVEGEDVVPIGVRRSIERLEHELAEAGAVVDELAAAVTELDQAAGGAAPERSLALELGVREAELAFLSIGLSSLQARVREVAASVSDAQRTLQGRSAEELLAFMARLELSLRGLG